MNIKKAYASNYLGAVDLEEGEDMVVTIEEVREEEVGQNKDEKPVVYFKGLNKGLILNKTNMNTICDILKSDETDDWEGKQITLYVAEVEYQGKMVESIRVRLRAPKKAGAAVGQAQTTRGDSRGQRPASTQVRRVAENDEEDYTSDDTDDPIPF